MSKGSAMDRKLKSTWYVVIFQFLPIVLIVDSAYVCKVGFEFDRDTSLDITVTSPAKHIRSHK